jgi:hypothetical protein
MLSKAIIATAYMPISMRRKISCKIQATMRIQRWNGACFPVAGMAFDEDIQ